MTKDDLRNLSTEVARLEPIADLISLARQISAPESFDPGSLTAKYLTSREYRRVVRKHKIPPIDVMVHQISELYVAQMLERNPLVNLNQTAIAAKILPDYFLEINADTHAAYVYRQNQGKVEQHPIAEVDAIGFINQETPFAIEVEIGKSQKNARGRINGVLTERRLGFLKDLFSGFHSFGYMLVVDPGNMAIVNSPEQRKFVEQGGIITPFPLPREKFIPFVASIRHSRFT